jgi:hypothetical protein
MGPTEPLPPRQKGFAKKGKGVCMEGDKKVSVKVSIYEIENRSKRAFIIDQVHVVKGGKAINNTDGSVRFIRFEADSTITLRDPFASKFLKDFQHEVRLVRQATRKE